MNHSRNLTNFFLKLKSFWVVETIREPNSYAKQAKKSIDAVEEATEDLKEAKEQEEEQKNNKRKKQVKGLKRNGGFRTEQAREETQKPKSDY